RMKSAPPRRGTNSYPEGPEREDILVATPTGLQGTHSDDRAGRRQRQTQQWSRLPLVQSSQQTALGLCVNRILGPWHSRSRGRCSSLILRPSAWQAGALPQQELPDPRENSYGVD